MSDGTRGRLEEAGSRQAPAPDPEFADALEVRLRAVGASLPVPPPTPRRRGLVPGGRAVRVGAALVTAALVVALGTSVLGPRPAPGPRPTLAEPVNVEVAFADGTVLEDPDGLMLPEGAVVTVGEEGSARVGDTLLAPGDIATVRDGRLEVERPPAGAATTPVRSPVPEQTSRPIAQPPTAAPPAGTATPVLPTSTPPRTPSPSPVAVRTPGPSPAPTARPAPTGPAATSAATAASTATPAPLIVRPRLRVRLIDGPRVSVRWTETWRARGYVLVVTVARRGAAPDPVYPGSRVLGEFAMPPERPLRYRVPDGVVELRLMVVALRRDGSVLRRSRVVVVEVPPGSDATGSGFGAGSDPTPSPDPAPSREPTPSPEPTPAP